MILPRSPAAEKGGHPKVVQSCLVPISHKVREILQRIHFSNRKAGEARYMLVLETFESVKWSVMNCAFVVRVYRRSKAS